MSDTLYVLAASYENVEDALSESEAIKVAYRHVGSSHALTWGRAAGAVAALTARGTTRLTAEPPAADIHDAEAHSCRHPTWMNGASGLWRQAIEGSIRLPRRRARRLRLDHRPGHSSVALEQHPPTTAQTIGAIVATALAVGLAETYSEFVGAEARGASASQPRGGPCIGGRGGGCDVRRGLFPRASSSPRQAVELDTAFTLAKWTGLALI